MTHETNLSAKQAAHAFANAKTKKAKDEVLAYITARAADSKRVRWAKLLDDVTKGDATRIKARATGDWSAVKAAREDAKAEPKAPAKPKTTAKRKAKPAAKPANTPAMTPEAVAGAMAEWDSEAMAAFFKLLDKARA
jgi:hypothetical protein